MDLSAHSPRINVVADLSRADHVPGDTYDCFVIPFTMHIIYDIEAALYHAVRILKPGGVLLVNFPCLYTYLGDGLDMGTGGTFYSYWFFTPIQVENLLRVIGLTDADFQLVVQGNLFTQIAYQMNLPAEHLTQRERDHVDMTYPLQICARMVKPAGWAAEKPPYREPWTPGRLTPMLKRLPSRVLPPRLREQWRAMQTRRRLDALRGRMMSDPPRTSGVEECLGYTVRINDAPNFYTMYKDLFVNRLYHFTASRPDPRILDCGSNIGMSILYFKRCYPQAQIVGFEADPIVYPYLEENIARNAPFGRGAGAGGGQRARRRDDVLRRRQVRQRPRRADARRRSRRLENGRGPVRAPARLPRRAGRLREAQHRGRGMGRARRHRRPAAQGARACHRVPPSAGAAAHAAQPPHAAPRAGLRVPGQRLRPADQPLACSRLSA
ncbi:MAG: hypothetical protein M5R40_27750 [Anaerolineae bacterium]|nr:hypothetical protein [Anaerolineae bacterium]